MPTKKKLIEVALPLEAINKASAREKSIRHGHPSTLHLWWAQRPLAAARTVIFAQMVDAPSTYVDVLRDDWDPSTDVRLTVWEMVHHLVRALDRGEAAAADLVAQLGSKADTARERAYRLYTLCERKTASLAIESQATGNLKPWR